LYGLIDVGYAAKTIEGSTGTVLKKQTGVMDGGYAGNRIGFRGTEDLGAGQAVGFTIEQGISPTNASQFGVRTATAGFQLDGYAASTGRFDQGTAGGYSQGNNRQSFASLSDNSLGELRVGYQYTALYEVSTLMGFTTMSEGVIGGSSSHTHGNVVAGGTRANGINYISPRMSGFGLSVQSGSGANRDTTEFSTQALNTANGSMQARNKRTSLKLDYAQGPWMAAYANTSFVNATGGTAAGAKALNVYGALTNAGVTNASTPAQSAAVSDTAYNTSLNQIAGAYTASNWKIGYQRISGTLNVTAADSAGTAGTYTTVGTNDFKAQRVSGQYTIGKFDLIAGQGTSTVDSGATRYMDLKETQIGAIYNVSKRAKLYAYQGQWTDNAAQAAVAAGNYKAKQTIVGLVTSF
jgi:predicted porin